MRGFTVDATALRRLFVSQVEGFSMSNRSQASFRDASATCEWVNHFFVQDRQSLALGKVYISSCLLCSSCPTPSCSCPVPKRIQTFGPAHRICIASSHVSHFSCTSTVCVSPIPPHFNPARDAASVCVRAVSEEAKNEK